jgi:hypothetical protein
MSAGRASIGLGLNTNAYAASYDPNFRRKKRSLNSYSPFGS